ncbi:MAG: class I SAM-dependent methyltransferase [Halobacteriovoraceae bacterium]|nr:class I SAM-dependent methyltransferase [Halobacteriovoraceae bacterium]
MLRFTGSGDIRDIAIEYISALPDFDGKVIVDIPAGEGFTSRAFHKKGAEVLPVDLFPQFFKDQDLECIKGDITNPPLPIKEGQTDVIMCQEGIEHFQDQVLCFKEFNRLLKVGGSLYMTTPNYSHLRSRLSYFLIESDFYKRLPANELDDIWFAANNEVYFGHIFLVNFQKLRTMAVLTGFKVKKVIPTKVSMGSLLIGLFAYPFILLVAFYSYLKNMSKQKSVSEKKKTEVYGEIFKYLIHPSILFGKHLFIEFEKVKEASESMKYMKENFKAPSNTKQ